MKSSGSWIPPNDDNRVAPLDPRRAVTMVAG